jgi:hypothetical protein
VARSATTNIEAWNAGNGQAVRRAFFYVDLEQRVRADHPLRAIRLVVNEALEASSGEFSAL